MAAHSPAGLEAVFSSSEDRIPAQQSSVRDAGISIALPREEVDRVSSLKAEKASAPTKIHSSNAHAAQSWAVHIAQSVFTVLFPSDCRICRAPLTNISRLPVCQDCLDQIQPLRETLCAACGERIPSPFTGQAVPDLRCGLCQRLEPPFARAVAYGSYETGLRELVHLLKFDGVRPAAKILGAKLAQAMVAIEPGIAKGTVLVIPVPLYKGRRRQRGFNQAELITRAALRHVPRERFVLACDVLRRKRDTHSQVALTSHQRRENLRGAFSIARAEKMVGREVVLVDDVYTTGATAMECSRVLRRAGAAKVWVVTVGRTMKSVTYSVERKPPASVPDAENSQNPAGRVAS